MTTIYPRDEAVTDRLGVSVLHVRRHAEPASVVHRVGVEVESPRMQPFLDELPQISRFASVIERPTGMIFQA